MTWSRGHWAGVGGGFLVAVGVGALTDSTVRGIVATLCLVVGVYLISLAVTHAGSPVTTSHRHTFGPWETSWYLNENGSKAQVCEQIQKCTGCGYIKRRKP